MKEQGYEGVHLTGHLLRLTFMNPVFYLAILGIFLTALLPAWPDIRMEYEVDVRDILYLFQFPFDVTSFSRITPLLAAMTAAAGFAMDYNSRAVQSMICRMKTAQYTASRFAVCAVSGFLTVLLGWLLYIGVLSFFYPVVNLDGGNYEVYCSRLYGMLLYRGHPFLYMLAQITGLALAGALWASVGMAASAFIPNRYFAVAIPFLINGVLYNLTSDLHWWFSPSNVGKGLQIGDDLTSFLVMLGYFFVLLLLSYVAFHVGAKRRIHHA